MMKIKIKAKITQMFCTLTGRGRCKLLSQILPCFAFGWLSADSVNVYPFPYEQIIFYTTQDFIYHFFGILILIKIQNLKKIFEMLNIITLNMIFQSEASLHQVISLACF